MVYLGCGVLLWIGRGMCKPHNQGVHVCMCGHEFMRVLVSFVQSVRSVRALCAFSQYVQSVSAFWARWVWVPQPPTVHGFDGLDLEPNANASMA